MPPLFTLEGAGCRLDYLGRGGERRGEREEECVREEQVGDVPRDGGRTYTGSQLSSLGGPSHQVSFVSYQIVIRNTKSGLTARS